eukprot:7530149-Karenia_brevis.AAC.1
MQLAFMSIERRLQRRRAGQVRWAGQLRTLDWVPREENQDADDISKGQFSKFDPGKRVQVDISKFEVMKKMMLVGRELYEELAVSKLQRKAEKAADVKMQGTEFATRNKRVRLTDKTRWGI